MNEIVVVGLVGDEQQWDLRALNRQQADQNPARDEEACAYACSAPDPRARLLAVDRPRNIVPTFGRNSQHDGAAPIQFASSAHYAAPENVLFFY